MASSIMLTTVNVYQAEIWPPALRGTMLSPRAVTTRPSEYATTGSPAWGKLGVACVMIFIFSFAVTNAASPYAYAAEVLPTKNRAVGVALAKFCASSVTLIFSHAQPIALEKIGWKMNLVFVGCNLFFLPIVYFYFKETKGLTLEVNLAFGETVEVEMHDMDNAGGKATVLARVDNENEDI
ncbi:hypothetical protein SEUCBS139899_010743 [Sporothrix eucalyptigena]